MDNRSKFYRFMYITLLICTILSILRIIWLIQYYFWDPTKYGMSSKIAINTFSFMISNFEWSDGIVSLIIIQSLIVSFLLWKTCIFFKNISEEKIFVIQNAKAIIHSGIALGLAAFFTNIPSLMLSMKLLPYISFSQGKILVDYHFNIELFVASIAVLVLGMIFRKAVYIAQENEFTI